MTQRSGKEWKGKKGHQYSEKVRKETQIKKEGKISTWKGRETI
jgi:hypothetical protein